MVPFPQNFISKDPGNKLPPGFWIGLILILTLMYLVNQCKGGVVP